MTDPRSLRNNPVIVSSGRNGTVAGLGIGLVAIVVGIGLRLWNLSLQILAGDELHSVRRIVEADLGEILTRYQGTDHCIPLTALFELWHNAGGNLTESLLRAPNLIAGIAALALLPWLANRALGPGQSRGVAVWSAVLLAVSPALVYYSRIARPYMIVVLVCILAAAAFWRWWTVEGPTEGPNHRSGIGALLALILSSALAAWFHLGTLPFIAGFFVFGLVDAIVRSRDGSSTLRSRLFRLVGAGFGIAAALSLFALPALDSLLRLFEVKRVAGSPTLDTWIGVGEIQAGTGHSVLTAAFCLLAIGGGIVLSRQRPRLAAFTTTLVVVHLGGIVWLSPLGVEVPIILNRYLLVLLPIAIFWVAVALDVLWRSSAKKGLGALAARRAVAIGVVACLIGFGAMVESPELRFGPFAGSNAAISIHEPSPYFDADQISNAYRLLAQAPDQATIVETPWPSAWGGLEAPLALARAHRREVILTNEPPLPDTPGLELRHLISWTPDAVMTTSARFVFVHRDPGSVDARVSSPLRPERRMRHGPGSPSHTVGHRIARTFEAAWGAPDLEEGELAVWDLDRLRLRNSDLNAPFNRKNVFTSQSHIIIPP